MSNKELKYPEGYTGSMIITSGFFTFFAIAAHWMFKGQPGVKIGYACFDAFAIANIYGYMYFKCKKIVYEDNKFIVSGFLKTTKKYNIEDITKVVETPGNYFISFKNNKKLTIDKGLNNSSIVVEIMKERNISIKSLNGNISPKGW